MFFTLLGLGFLSAVFCGFSIGMVISVILLRKSNEAGDEKGKLKDYTKEYPILILESRNGVYYHLEDED